MSEPEKVFTLDTVTQESFDNRLPVFSEQTQAEMKKLVEALKGQGWDWLPFLYAFDDGIPVLEWEHEILHESGKTSCMTMATLVDGKIKPLYQSWGERQTYYKEEATITELHARLLLMRTLACERE